MYMHVIVTLMQSDCEEEEQMSMVSEEWRRERFQREELLQQQVGFIVFN